jgi:PAS domain S-box-containing protein
LRNNGHDQYIESFVNIQPLKKAEAELRASEARYRQFFEEDITGDFICTPQGRILDCNPAFARLLGYASVDQVLDANLFDYFFSEGDRQAVFDHIESKGRQERMEWKLRHRNGQPIYCIGNAIVRRETTGWTREYQVYLFDETRRVLLEKELRQNQKLEAIGTLAGGIAHDFNNLLAGIVGFAELSLKKVGAEGDVREYLRKILAASEKARMLIAQLLAFSRTSETDLQPVALRSLIEEILPLLRVTLPATIAIKSHLHAEGVVLADSVQIHQVLLNLCANAGHAMRAQGGTLTLTLDAVTPGQDLIARYPDLNDGAFARLGVIDTGEGMAPEVLSRIFDPFFTTKPKEEGTGLGLSVVHGIVQNLKGEIVVASTPGVGTRFELYLPLTNVPLAAKPLEGSASEIGNEHIVYADDEPFLVEIGREILLELGYRVTAFMDSAQALAYVRQHHAEVDLIISDFTMPGLTGIALARCLRQEGITTPMIICTGYQKDLGGEDLESLGIREVLIKPITQAKLASTVRRVLDDARGEFLA